MTDDPLAPLWADPWRPSRHADYRPDMVRALLACLGLALAPVAVLAVTTRLIPALRERYHQRHPAAPAPTRPPLERVAADLRRLGRELDLQAEGRVQASAVKQTTIIGLYEQRLADACDALDVEQHLTEVHGLDRELERLRVESQLGDRGLRLR